DLHPAGVDRIAIWIAAPRTVEGQRGELGPRRRRARDRDRRAIAAGGPEGDLLREWQVGESVEDNVVDVPAERRDSGEVGRPDAEAHLHGLAVELRAAVERGGGEARVAGAVPDEGGASFERVSEPGFEDQSGVSGRQVREIGPVRRDLDHAAVDADDGSVGEDSLEELEPVAEGDGEVAAGGDLERRREQEARPAESRIGRRPAMGEDAVL